MFVENFQANLNKYIMYKNIRKLKLLIVAGVFLISSSVFSQIEIEPKSQERFNHSLGFGAGVSTGIGLSYRYFGEKLGAQVNFMPYKDEGILIMSSGLTFLYRLVELEDLSFFVYQGNHFFFSEETVTNKSYDYPGAVETITTIFEEDKYFNNGAGIGIEWVRRSRLGLNAMAGFGGQEYFKKLNFTGEVAVYFKF